MVSSMTGYGKGIVEAGEFSIETEVKSLNNRFLDISFRMPKSLTNKEFELREQIKKRLKRGKIFLSINVFKNGNNNKNSSFDITSIQRSVDALSKIKKAAKIKGRISLSELFAFQASNYADSLLDVEKEWESIEKSITLAFNNLEEMRKKEGLELAKDLKSRVNLITDTVTKIEAESGNCIKEYFDKLRGRAEELINEFKDFNDRLEMELALLSEKYDVTEECVRMKSHIKMFLDALESSDEAGRKLNFICQEMNREVNTINSKSVSTEISHLGILIKEELEKIREQIQNIE
ncbi:YicC/YloC family endoribonuclease [Bacteroidota bacterium]